MGWYLRKSFSFGPLRLNLSKSGLGYSLGVKGARIGTGPRGNYVHMGRYGLYYRQYFNQNAANGTPARPRPVAPTESTIVGTIIPTADVTQLRDSSAEELLGYIRKQHRKATLAPWISGAAALLVAGMIAREVAFWLVASCAVLAIVAHFVISRFDASRKRVILGYTLDDSASTKYASLLEAAKALGSSQRLWRITTSDRSLDTKYTAGATDIISRKNASISLSVPPHIDVNLPVWRMVLGAQSLYFFPDRALVYQGAEIGAVSYADLGCTCCTTRFVEAEGVPSDARVVGTNWRYSNKGGGPDRRFANNPQIPLAEYAQIELRSSAGVHFVLHCSNVAAAEKFVAGLSGYCSTVMTAHVAESSGASMPNTEAPAISSSALEQRGWAAAPVLLTVMLAALLMGPRGNYLQPPPSSTSNASEAVQAPLPRVRVLYQRGTQIAIAVPEETSDTDLRRLLENLRVKVESSKLSELGIKSAKQVSSVSQGTIFVFRTAATKVPATTRSDAVLKWQPHQTTATLRQADGTRVSVFGPDPP